MQTESLIDQLVADLGPVRPRSRAREALLLGGLDAIEILLFVTLQDLRPDMPVAMATPAFWWKSGSFALIAILSAAAMLTSLDPATTTPRRLA
ncbi:MAG: DUF1109 family protein, partial [Sandarakinorhabdus sp.]|nr:DUF1109 family protein [Sandarakinorhabdus sp.]